MASHSKPSSNIGASASKVAAENEGSRPTELPTLANVQAQNDANSLAVPSLQPPIGGISAKGLQAGNATAWGSQTVGGLWSINEDKNAWVYVNSIGWVKLSNASDPGIVALMALSASAKQTGSAINYRQEADGMIHEIYLW